MGEFKHIDIAEPIWKTRSVGLAVDDVPIGELVKVTISYRSKKDGKLSFPGEYLLQVNDIRQFPISVIKGNTRVHVVPIKEMANLNLKISNQLKPQNMLFGSNELSKIIKESEEAKAGNFENKEMITPGKYVMTLLDVKLEHAKSDNNPMIVAEFELDENHRTIKEFMKIAGPNTEIPREKLVKLFHRGFGYEIKPSQTEADLITQLVAFKGKKLSVAVKGHKKAYSFQDKDKKDVVMEQTYPEFWYCGSEAEFEDFYIDMTKSIKELSSEDKNRLVAFAEINGGPYIPKAKPTDDSAKVGTAIPESAPQAATPAPAPVAEQAKIPAQMDEVPVQKIEAEAPVQEEKAVAPEPVQAETPVAPAPEAPKTEGGGDDDFPF